MNPKNNFEIYTSTDKAQRDKLFQALRASSDPFERQAVKFSGVEPVIGADGLQALRRKQYFVSGAKAPRLQYRPVYQSTWSVAHPKAENGEYYSGGKQ
jgi:hypothetical protein